MISKLYAWYGRKTVWGATLIIVALVVTGAVITWTGSEETTSEAMLPTVQTATVASLSGQEELSLIGTVRAVSEAQIQSETAGRVTAVPVQLGETVAAGAVIARLENASERAAVLQAEGAYEAALANASAGDVSVEQARTSLRAAQNTVLNNLQSNYTTVSNGFYTVIDDLYDDPNSPLTTPRLATGDRSYFRTERVAFQDILPAWQQSVSALTTESDLEAALRESITRTSRARSLVDAFVRALQDRESQTLNGVSVPTWISEFNRLRTSLDSSIASLEAARTNLVSAQDGLRQAEISGTQTEVSSANAQVKQALGSLRAAEANLAKTILRSPIAGTVNELDVNVGDFLSSFTTVAKVANNQALEVTVFVSEADLARITVGSEVLIENEYEGVVTNIGAGLDSDTQKTEVKIATEASELVNGDTVTVTLTSDQETSSDVTTLPITAVKFTAENGFVYTVADNTLVEHAVAVGDVRGSSVVINQGVTSDMEVVVDARGLTAGAQVEARN